MKCVTKQYLKYSEGNTSSANEKKTLTLLAKEYYKEFCTIKRIKFKSKLHVWVRILLMTLYLPVSSKKCY